MPDAAEALFEDEGLDWVETAVDEMILRSGGDERKAIRALIIDLAEAHAATSLGYQRGVQPARPGK